MICLLYRADMHRTRAAMRLEDALVAHGKRLDARDRADAGESGLASTGETLYRS